MPIKVVDFGGLYPKASARALPGDGAQIALDIQPGTREFRPLGQDTVVVANSGVTNPKTIYRLQRKADGTLNTDMTTGWIVKSIEMSFVKAQINEDTSERTFATFDDGSSAPWVYDATDTVTGRQLGVPAPTSAPTLVVNRVPQFSTEDRAAAVKAATDYFTTLASDTSILAHNWFGKHSTDPTDYRPGTSTDGYLDIDDSDVTIDEAVQVRVWRLSSTGGANDGGISDTYDSLDPSAYQWALDPSLGGFYKTSSSSPAWPTWASTSKDHWCVPFVAYAQAYTPDGAALRTALAAMQMPGTDTPTDLFTSDQLDDIDTVVAAALDAKWTAGAQYLNALKAEVDAMHVMLGGGGAAQRLASIAAFYAQTDVSDEIDNAKSNLAEALFGIAAREAFYTDFTGFEGGGP